MTILGQSQPRVSRHLKLLLEAGLVERRREGAWAFFHAPEKGAGRRRWRAPFWRGSTSDDPVLAADRARLEEVRASRAAQAQKYFAEHAPIWDETRRLHAPEAEVEAAILAAALDGAPQLAAACSTSAAGPGACWNCSRRAPKTPLGVDLSAGHARRGAGALEQSPACAMCNCARATSTPCRSTRTSSISPSCIRFCIISTIPPAPCARRRATLAPGGRLIVVDFAPHHCEMLREKHAASPSRLRRATEVDGLSCGRRGWSRCPIAISRPAATMAEDKNSPFPFGWRAIRARPPHNESMRPDAPGAEAQPPPPPADRRVVRILSAEIAGNGDGPVGGDRAPRAAAPNFVSVTYGAGGSTRERTHATVARILRETAIKPAAHLTCVGATRDEVDEVARAYWDVGVRHIVALRGDPQGGLGGAYAPTPGGYAHSTDLVARPARHRRFRNLGLGLSGKTSRERQLRAGHRRAQAPRSTRARPARSRSSSSTTTSISAFSTACARRESPSRSCRA